MIKIVLAASVLFATLSAFCQITNREDYDLKRPNDLKSSCKKLYSVLESKPDDVRFSTIFIGDSVFIIHNDEDWFFKIIPSRNDGIAIDILQKQQYQCDNVSRLANSWSHRGFLLPPVYRDEIRKQIRHTQEGYILAYVGLLPKSIKRENAEANYKLVLLFTDHK